MDVVRLSTGDWEIDTVFVPRGFFERWRGLRGADSGTAMLIRGRSVHGFGLSQPFVAVGIDKRRSVGRLEVVSPGSISVMALARWILELPVGSALPRVGDVIEVSRG